jgi:4-hydroxy-tetrahydrodipicolinate synthase
VRTDSDFSGLWIPLITPMRDGAVDHAALAALVKRLTPTGIAGFVVGATTGEAPLLSDDERQAVLATVARSTTLRLVVGVSDTTAAGVLRRMQGAIAFRPAAFLVAAPGYVRPSQTALQAHFAKIADAAPAPLMLYDVPARTGVQLELETLRDLSHHPRILALKDCGSRAHNTEALIAEGRLQVLCGNDAEWFASRCLGGSGAVAASAHVRTDLFVAFDDALAAGQLRPARALWRHLAPLTRALFDEPNPAPVKALLAAAGDCVDELREPLTRASPTLRARLGAIVGALPASV